MSHWVMTHMVWVILNQSDILRLNGCLFLVWASCDGLPLPCTVWARWSLESGIASFKFGCRGCISNILVVPLPYPLERDEWPEKLEVVSSNLTNFSLFFNLFKLSKFICLASFNLVSWSLVSESPVLILKLYYSKNSIPSVDFLFEAGSLIKEIIFFKIELIFEVSEVKVDVQVEFQTLSLLLLEDDNFRVSISTIIVSRRNICKR